MHLYVVRNSEGLFFRPAGHAVSGGGCWDELEIAKFYPTFGKAKARVTTWMRYRPAEPCPEILEFTLDPAEARVIDMTELTAKTVSKIAQRNAERDEAYRVQMVEHLRQQRAEIDQRLKTL